MATVLLTGMSGSGKSTVLAELAGRGRAVLDTDHGGWTQEVRAADGSVDHRWDEPRMAALLAQTRVGALFVSGCVSNQAAFYDRFNAVVLLSAPVEVLLARLASRTTNGYGKDPAERERILDDLAEVEPLLRRTATTELDTRRSVPDLADAVEALVR